MLLGFANNIDIIVNDRGVVEETEAKYCSWEEGNYGDGLYNKFDYDRVHDCG